MEKTDIYKIFALGLVAVFVIEMIALGALNTNSSKPAGQQAGAQGALDLTGNVADNVTIVRYEPYLIVNGNGSAIGETRDRLVASGEITYAVAAGSSLIVDLNGSSSVLYAAAEFEKANATVLANAVIAMPDKVRIAGDGLITEAAGTTFKWQLRPIYPEGSKIPATFVARAESGQVTGMGSLVLLPEFISGATAKAAVESAAQDAPLIQVPWAARDAARQLARGEGASYREKSFIAILQNATQAQLGAASGRSYVTGVQPGVVSVGNSFSDEGTARADLAGLEPSFPSSIAYFANATANRTEALLGKLRAGGINATLVPQARLRVALPASVEGNGKNYSTGNRVLEVEASESVLNATSIMLRLDFEAAGSAITRIISASVAQQAAGAAQTESQPTAPPAQNGTGAAAGNGTASANGSAQNVAPPAALNASANASAINGTGG